MSVGGVSASMSVGVLMAVLCGFASILLASLAWVEPGWGLWLGLVLATLLGLTIASYAPIAQSITVEMVSPHLSGSALGYNLLGVFIGGMLGPPIFGAILDQSGSFAVGWLVTAVITAFGTFILVKWFKEGGSTN